MEYQQSLLEYLMQKNPDIDASKGGKGGNTKSYSESYKWPIRIVEWTDFQPQSLLNSFEGRLNEILKTSFTGSAPRHIPAFPFRQVHDEDSLETLLILWTQQIVSNALDAAQDQLPTICSSGRVYMARGGQAKFLAAFPKDRKKRNSYPDWAAVRHKASTQSQDSKSENILPGDTKISSKWKSKNLAFGDRLAYNAKPDTARPVLQVYNYCLQANVRYGYIISDQELVVLRLRTVTDTNGNDSQQGPASQEFYASETQKQARWQSEVELKSVPWNFHDQSPRTLHDKLTVNLALWWLHLMAATRCSIESDYPSLSDELLPLDTTGSTSFSFSEKIAGIDLAQSASFTSDMSEPRQTRKKRKRLEPQMEEIRSKRRDPK